MEPFAYDALPGRVVFGAGVARTELAGEIARLGVSRLLLIAGGGGQSVARDLAVPLGDRIAGTFTGIRPHVPVEVADAARKQAAAVGADSVLSVGGGSATGTAKAVALTTGLPVIAVPTTYAGSEVTPVWGLTEGERKTTGVDSRVLPRLVIYDPELTLSLPGPLSAASGLNAMAHCVDAFWAPGRNPVSALAAGEAIRVLAAALPAVSENGTDAGARGDLLYGAYLAGTAFAVTGSGLHHKICHVLGGRYGLPHAQTHAIMLPYVLAFNAPGAPDAARRIGRALGSEDPAAALQMLAARLGLPRGLRDIGLREEQLAEAARLIEPVVPADNPVPASPAALQALLRHAWVGDPAGLSPAGPGPRGSGPPGRAGRPRGRGDRRGAGQFRRRGRTPLPGGHAEPGAEPARVRARGAAHRGRVAAGDRLPDPGRAHHRRPASGVHPALGRARALHDDRGHQRAGVRGSHRVRPWSAPSS